MNFIKNNLANAFTLGNLLSGSIGVIHLILMNYQITAVCIIISLVLDFFDGFVARATKSDSKLGAQLDSLADMVSFGLLPGIAIYQALSPFGNHFFGIELPFPIRYFALFITAFSCLRLAIFNIDEEQKYYFKGLNTPSNTILIFGLFYAYLTERSFQFLFENSTLLIILVIISSYLLVSPIKMIAMKFKSMKIEDNIPKIVLLIGSLLMLTILKTEGIPLVIVYYIIVSLLFQRQLK